jgi:hypothetical protein
VKAEGEEVPSSERAAIEYEQHWRLDFMLLFEGKVILAKKNSSIFGYGSIEFFW